jgi:hypothetical protein
VGPQAVFFVKRFTVLCPYFRESTNGISTVSMVCISSCVYGNLVLLNIEYLWF